MESESLDENTIRNLSPHQRSQLLTTSEEDRHSSSFQQSNPFVFTDRNTLGQAQTTRNSGNFGGVKNSGGRSSMQSSGRVSGVGANKRTSSYGDGRDSL